MNLTGGAGALPDTFARTIVEEGASTVRKLASTVRNDERLGFARAVALAAVSAYWKERQALSGRGWRLRELPSDMGLAPVPDEAAEQAERVGIAAAGCDVLDAGYAIGALYTGMMAAAACLLMLVRPMLGLLGGAGWEAPPSTPVPAGFAMKKKTGRREWLRVSLGEDGAARKAGPDGSALLRVMANADGLLDVPEDVAAIAPGDRFAMFRL